MATTPGCGPSHAALVAGCASPWPAQLPKCPGIRLVVDNSSAVAQSAAFVSANLRLLPTLLLQAFQPSCLSGLQDLFCSVSGASCAFGAPLPPCASVCEDVRAACSEVLDHFPPEALVRLDCARYPAVAWPSCAVADSPAAGVCSSSASEAALLEATPAPLWDLPAPWDTAVASSSALPAPWDAAAPWGAGSAPWDLAAASLWSPPASSPRPPPLSPLPPPPPLPMCASSAAELPFLLEEPSCGVCAAGVFAAAERDACGVCNGDGGASAAGDGAGECACGVGGLSFDACGECGGDAAECSREVVGPRGLGSAAVAASVAAAALLVLALRCRPRTPTPTPALLLWQQRIFFGAGRCIARKPWATMGSTAALALLFGCGLLRVQIVVDPLSLWLPDASTSAVHAARVRMLTGRPDARFLQVLVEPGGTGAAAPLPLRDGLLASLSVHEALSAVPPGRSAVTLAGAPTSSGVWSPLELWLYDRRRLLADPDPAATLARAVAADGIDGGFTAVLLGGQLATQPPLQGGAAELPRNDTALSDTALSALLLNYFLDGSPARKSEVDAWEMRVSSLLLDGGMGGGGAGGQGVADVRVSVRSNAVFNADIASATADTALLISVGIGLTSMFVCLFLSRDRSCLGARPALGGAAIGSVMLATAAAFGVCAGAGVKYNEMVSVALFVMLGVGGDDAVGPVQDTSVTVRVMSIGVGVDDAFLFVRALEDVLAARQKERQHERAQPPPQPTWVERRGVERFPSWTQADASSLEASLEADIGAALAAAGPSILLSSTTNALLCHLGPLASKTRP